MTMPNMDYVVAEDGKAIAQFLRADDANEFLSNAQWEDGYRFYELVNRDSKPQSL
jgi:hypothetical protein